MTDKKSPEDVAEANPVPGEKKSVVKQILERVEKRLTNEDMKVTLGDYIRLVQLERELDENEPREIKVTWIEPVTTKSENEG